MILAIDIGNTNIVLGCLNSEEDVTFVERLSTDRGRTALEYAISIKNVLEMYGVEPKHLEGAIISSVVPPITSVVRRRSPAARRWWWGPVCAPACIS